MKKYLIPKNVSTKFELMNGIGIKELAIILGSVIVGFLITTFTGNPFFVIVIGSISYLVIRQDDNGLNILNTLKCYYDFMNTQQFYKYEKE